VYATTASNADESSWGTYCPGENPSPPPEYDTCLGLRRAMAGNTAFNGARTYASKVSSSAYHP